MLSWAPVDSALQYDVRFRRRGQSVWNIVPNISGTDTLLQNLLPSTPYQWAVRVRCQDSLSAWSDPQEFETLRDPGVTCEPPVRGQVIFVADSTVRFVWSEVSNALYYELRYRLAEDTTWLLQGPLGNTEQVVADLLPDTLYQWQVRVICFEEELDPDWSEIGEFLIPGPNLDCPQPFNPEATALGEQTLLFSWDPSPTATLYRLRFRIVGTTVWTLQDSINNNSLVLSGLQTATLYQWEVGALCEGRVSFWTEGPEFRTWIPPTVTLVQPSDSVVINEGDSLTLIARAFDEDGEIESIAFYSNGALLNETLNADSASYQWQDIPRGFYQVFVIATDSDGLQHTSDTLTVVVGFDPNNIILGDFLIEGNRACEVNAEGILFTDASVGASSYLWSFGEGASPDSATSVGPHRVRYATSGTKTITLRVQNDNGAVDIASKTVEVFITPPRPFAGVDTMVCEGGYTMQAQTVQDGVGSWRVLAGNGVIEDVSNPNTQVTGLRMGTNVFEWKAINGSCESEPDTVVIRRMRCEPKTPSEITGPDTLCIGVDPANFVFSVPADTSVDKYVWVTPQGIEGDIDSNTLVITSFTGRGGNIQVIAENEVGQSDPVSIFVVVDSCRDTGISGSFACKEFTAFLKGDQVVLDWTVGFDGEIAGYRIERSLDSMMFLPIDTLTANRQNLPELKYRTLDNAPFEGMAYYRLTAIDIQGAVACTKVIKLSLGIDVPPGEVTVFPNPISQQDLNLAVEASNSGEMQVQVTNAVGQIIFFEVFSINTGFNNLVLETESWPKGIYYIFANQLGTEANFGFKVEKSSTGE